MTNRDLLKEAIADAKAIKETAIANAKAALEESFTPHLKSILSAKINEMDNFYEEDDTMEEAIDEITDDLDEMKEKEEIEEVEAEIEEINLDELLAELTEETEEVNEVEEVEEAKEEKEEEESEEEESEEEIDLENMSEEDLKNFIEGVIEDMIADGEIEAGHEGMEDEDGAEDEGEELDEDFNIDEILAELKDEEEMEEGMKKEETEAMKSELKEAYAAIKTLRTELNEINVLNAKLLYTNKIFKAKNLTESEKVKVLTAFDKATSKNEAKLVYETLIESLNNKSKTPIKENLGRASKPAGAMQTKKPIVESNEMISRFQKLAGII